MNSLHPPASTVPSESKLRLHSIDILRGLAALAVAFYHIWGHDGGYAFSSYGIVPKTLSPSLFTYLISPFRWGYLGVSLFLVLSGFCIHLPYARKKYSNGSYEFQGKQFYRRRIWRLYPAYFVAVVVTTVALIILNNLPNLSFANHFPMPTTWDVVSHLTMLHGLFENQFYSIASIFWSLSLEFQLYLAYPLFLLAFRKFGVGKSVIFFILLSILWRFFAITYLHNGLISVALEGPFVAMGSLPARMAEWLSGAFLAEIFAMHFVKRTDLKKISGKRPLFILLSVICFFGAIFTTLYQDLWLVTDPLFGLSFAFLIAAVILPKLGSTDSKPPNMISSAFIQLGIISYSFYLIHSQFGWIVSIFVPSEEGNAGAFIIRIILLVVSIIPIYYFYKWFEKPFLFPPKSNPRISA